jgi:hypothetical protein
LLITENNEENVHKGNSLGISWENPHE